MRSIGLALALLMFSSCVAALTSKELAKVRAQAEAENERAYQAALARAELTPAEAPGPQQMFDASGPEPADNVYVTGRWSEESAAPAPPAHFARDAEGKLWHVDRRPRAEVAEPLTVEGCYRNYRGGVTPTEYVVGYVLPQGLTIAGRKQIEYPARALAIHHRDGPCDRGPARP